MGKKAAPKKKVEAAPEPEPLADWDCPECETPNEGVDVICCACEAARPAAECDNDKFKGYKVGIVVSAEKVEGKDKLQRIEVDIGSGTLPIVTNAQNVKEGVRVIVATVGAIISDKGEDVEVKKASVGGCISEGMLCDAPMLGWTGGGAGAAALLPESFTPGERPPDARPRMDGK
uniref:tRNA-binding domain-containing protein n=1 Tax=Noctiluca scintillans TaxID=2966 RepID=A0A7S1EYW2_NOCSC